MKVLARQHEECGYRFRWRGLIVGTAGVYPRFLLIAFDLLNVKVRLILVGFCQRHPGILKTHCFSLVAGDKCHDIADHFRYVGQKASLSVNFNCHHSGVFIKTGDNLEFVDGELVVLEVDSGCVFTFFMSKLIERRIVIGKMRFKLPYESLEDCKPLWEKVEFNKKKLGIAGRWYKEVDLYIEKDVTGRETEASIPEKET
ncbi:hypothetical protein DY000_02025491 [Brassica cretica]|uniref:Uncharacterized protein n=1 Tax=Brassica cretica TaxID=69181 RepID=A0ABQ7EBI2_BRACR|nr:hypothetical protein DY000_02025491 [Brassica cretica]